MDRAGWTRPGLEVTTQPKRKTNPALVGCLVALAVFVLAVGGAAYYFLGRPALAVFNATRDIGRIQQLDSRVSNRASFTPPSDGLLSQQQVDRYLSISRQVVSGLESGVAVLDERYREVSAGSSGTPSFAGFQQAASAWADLLKLVVRAKETQVNALNASGFSLAEYRWVRSQVLGAAGVSFFEVDLTTLLEQAGNPEVRRPTATVPQANVELVAPHVDELERLVPLAVFGL